MPPRPPPPNPRRSRSRTRNVDYIWTPWRYQYVTGTGPGTAECIFCAAARGEDDRASLVVHRDERVFVILNRFPYTNGHVMVVPVEHVATLGELQDETAVAMMRMAREVERRLRELYAPDGINIGINMGRSAGAGIADHIHMHVLPRWIGDTNFMTVTGETRVLPETLDVTWERLSTAFGGR
jgi:ATP adenylyltransferase